MKLVLKVPLGVILNCLADCGGGWGRVGGWGPETVHTDKAQIIIIIKIIKACTYILRLAKSVSLHILLLEMAYLLSWLTYFGTK